MSPQLMEPPGDGTRSSSTGFLSKLKIKIMSRLQPSHPTPSPNSAASMRASRNSVPNSPPTCVTPDPHASPLPHPLPRSSLPTQSTPPITIPTTTTTPGPHTVVSPRPSGSAINPHLSHLSTASVASGSGLKSMLSDIMISHNDLFPNSADTGSAKSAQVTSTCFRSVGPGLAETFSEPIRHSPVLLTKTGSCGTIRDPNPSQAPSPFQASPIGSSSYTAACMDGSTLAAAEAKDASDPQLGQLSGASILSAELSSWDEESKGDLRAFASRIVHEGGWVGLGPEERSVIVDHYRSKGLNLEALRGQVKKEAHAAVMNNKLSDLEYISWDDITGRRGPSSALDKIHTGSKATLYRGRWHGQDVVVKKMDGADKRMQDELSREIYIMSTCTHPNIARIFGIARDPVTDMTCIVMKLYKRGSLLDVMTATEAATFTLAARIKMARGIARGMQYLHDRPNEMITHGDLNPRSILVDDRMRPIITDFGLSTMKTQTKTLVSSTGTRSVLYTAPEVLPLLLISGGLDYKPSPKADVYSFSMILFELFSGVVPFGAADMTEEKVLRLTACGQRPSISRLDAQGECIGPRDAGVGASVGIASPLADIVESCWNQDPELRPSFSQLISMLEAAAEALSLPVD